MGLAQTVWVGALALALAACDGDRETAQPDPARATKVETPAPARRERAPAPTHARAEEPRVPWVDCELRRETGYRKGEPFALQVLTIDGKLVERRTAEAYWAMREAALADGVELVIFSGFRSEEEQRHFYRCYRQCNCNDCNLAARPGFSNHQSGRALDIGQFPGVQDWLVANARRFGFKATMKSEPWHWEFRPGLKPDKTDWTPICPA